MPSADPPATDTPSSALIECADWLDFVSTLGEGSIDLVYADPPFNTGKTQRGTARHGLPGGTRSGTGAEPQPRQAVPSYDDSFDSINDWVGWLGARLEATLPSIKPTGSILLHVDWRTSHHARLLLDELLGPDRFVNHLIWTYGLGGSSPRRFARKHDDILFYAMDPDRYHFEPPMVPATSNRMRGEMKKATDVLDIPALNNMASERTGYPTQKPLTLLELLIGACCPVGGAVLDPCCGSGTTPVGATRIGRAALACDLNPDAVEITRSRLLGGA